jgi:hypothetical protein
VAQLTLIDAVKKLGDSPRYPIGGRQNHTVPSNVKQADNYYQRTMSPFAGGRITNESAQYRNHDMTDQGVTHNTIVKEALKQQSSAPPSVPDGRSGILDFMLDGGSGTAGISGAPIVVFSP